MNYAHAGWHGPIIDTTNDKTLAALAYSSGGAHLLKKNGFMVFKEAESLLDGDDLYMRSAGLLTNH